MTQAPVISGFEGTTDDDLAALVALTLHVLVTARKPNDLVKIVLANRTGDLAVRTVSDANTNDEGCRISVSATTVDSIKPQEQ